MVPAYEKLPGRGERGGQLCPGCQKTGYDGCMKWDAESREGRSPGKRSVLGRDPVTLQIGCYE